MSDLVRADGTSWPWWRKLIFRFFFIYFTLYIAPWTWLDGIPGVGYVTGFYYKVVDWAVERSNAAFFHVRSVLVPLNGSGDTSYGWAQLWLFLCLACIGCILWSLVDRRRRGYDKLNYWLCLFTRYYVALVALSYGILKLFALQMGFPNLSQLATPLGDLLPMRLSWLFIGYSTPYQVFSGAMEVLAAVLLLYRRTVTLGVLFATAVFFNVMMLNLSYDIPVKIYSIHLVLFCLFLLASEYDRVICFFILNKPAAAGATYHFAYVKKPMRITRVVLKVLFVIIAVAMPFYNNWGYYKEVHGTRSVKPVRPGVYDVITYAINRDTIPALITDTLRWQDVIFEQGNYGSINTKDTLFRHRYGRGYFNYYPDTVLHKINMKRMQGDKDFVLSLRYELPDSNTIKLWGMQKNDSLYIELRRSPRHFQLAEKQFHWLSEYNR